MKAKFPFVTTVVLCCAAELATAQSSCTIDEYWVWKGSNSQAHATGTTYAEKEASTFNPLSLELLPYRIARGRARASDGTLGAYAHSEFFDPDQKYSSASYVETSATAFQQSYDLTVSGPNTLSAINGKLRFDLHGDVDPNGGRLFVNIYTGFTNQQLVIDTATGQAYYDPSWVSGPNYYGTHDISDIKVTDLGGGMEDVQFSDSVSLHPNVINPVSVSIQALATAQYLGSGDPPKREYQTVDYYDTLSFNPNGPAIELPTGYVANSPTWHIVNNQYVAVPEPSCILAGFSVLAAIKRRRRA